MARRQEESACGTGAGTKREAAGSADWGHANRVGGYTNGKVQIPRDTWFNTPFEGAEERIGRTVPVEDDAEAPLPIAAGRYRLIWTPLCPWATRSMIVRQLLGLDRIDPETGKEILSVGRVDPIRPEVPWSDCAFPLDPGISTRCCTRIFSRRSAITATGRTQAVPQCRLW